MHEGGAKNCLDCVRSGDACAKGGRVRDIRTEGREVPPSHLCPFTEHQPRTVEGALVLTLLRNGSCLKRGGWGFEGIDIDLALRRLATMTPRMPEWLALELLDHAEAGIFAGLALAREAKGE